MAAGNEKAQGKLHSTAFLLAIVGAMAALALACGAAGAWADEEAEVDSFDSVTDIAENAGETDGVASEAQDGAAIVDEAILEAFPGVAFDKKEMKVEVGTAHLVGFAPEASDAKSDDEDRASWHKSWKEAVESTGIDLSDESGWLKGKDDEGEDVDYSGITGIITEDKEVFELLGEFPEWKVDDEGTEYRWWYGLLGVAKKAGDAKLEIVYRDADGVNHVLDECTVHVVEAEEAGAKSTADDSNAQDDGSAPESDSEPGTESDSQATGASDETSGAAAGAAADEDDQTLGSQSSTEVSINTMANSSDSAASSDASASTNANDSSSSSASGSSTTTNNNTSTSAYPKEIFKTQQGAKIAGSLLARDDAAEKALATLGSSADLHLSIEVKTQLSNAAEKALNTLASNNGVSVAERLSVKVVDANNAEATISGMNLTVRVAADDTVKKLDTSSIQVWYVSDDGSTEKTSAKLSNGYLSFDTTHLSDFVVMGKASSSSSSTTGKSGLPQTGDTMAYVAIALAFVAGFSASSALHARRRMKE